RCWAKPASPGLVVALARRLRRLLPDRHVFCALACELFTIPTAPALTQGHAADMGHQVELRWPDVSKRHGGDLELPVDGGVVMGNQALRDDLELVETELRGAHLERPD